MNALKRFLAVLHALLERVAVKGAPHVEKVLGRLPGREDIEVVDFATDADLAALRQEPLRARILLRSVGLS
jgi:membrane fusion protein, adhesin transport system